MRNVGMASCVFLTCSITSARVWAPEIVHYERIVGQGVVLKQDIYPADHPSGPLAVHTFDIASQLPD